MERSKFLSKVIGIYLVIVSIAMFINMPQFLSAINGMINDTPLMFTLGFIILILGILMVVSHNIWQWHWRVLITIIAWLILLKGVGILFYPQFIDQMTRQFTQNMNIAYASTMVDFLLGLLFCWLGCKR
jgi:hypothetical protein